MSSRNHYRSTTSWSLYWCSRRPVFRRRCSTARSYWGVVGVLVMRALLIAFGIYLLARFHWLAYPFGALLAYAAIHVSKRGAATRWAHRVLPLHSWTALFSHHSRAQRRTLHCESRRKRYATPLLVALVAIESADLVFAVDSIPAVFAVTRDHFWRTIERLRATWPALALCGHRRSRRALPVFAPGLAYSPVRRLKLARPFRPRLHRYFARRHCRHLHGCHVAPISSRSATCSTRDRDEPNRSNLVGPKRSRPGSQCVGRSDLKAARSSVDTVRWHELARRSDANVRAWTPPVCQAFSPL